MKRFRSIPCALLALAASAGAASGLENLPTARDDSVLGAFQAQCLREEPVYDRLEQQAAARSMTDLGSHAAPGVDGGMVKSHRWGGKLDDGPFALYLSSVASKTAVETSCGVSGLVPDADHFRVGLTRLLALPPLPEIKREPTGSTIYVWQDFPVRDQRMILQAKTAKDGKGFVLVTVAVRRAP